MIREAIGSGVPAEPQDGFRWFDTLPAEADGVAGDDGDVSPPAVRFQGFDPGVLEKLVISSEMRSGLVEQYRRLAAGLHLAQIERPIKIVMVASAVPSEGKTLTATNVALTLSHSFKRRVLLIDADLRRPSMHAVFALPNGWGLNDALKAGAGRPPPIVPVSPRLSVMLAGRPDPDPIGALTSDRMRGILADAANTYEWIVIDTPPVGLLPDAHLLAGMVDTALLVIRAGTTPFSLIERAVEAIGRERIHGVVLNRVQQGAAAAGYTYYHYYGYYDSYFKKK